MAGKLPNATVEQVLSRIAARAHGVITRAEALAAGVTPDEFDHRVRIGYLIRVHRGIYRLGHAAPSSLAAYTAATKACGDGCGLSGFAAAHLLELQTDRPGQIEVTAPRDRRVPGLSVHHSRVRMPLMRVRGVPVVTPAWALIDIAGRLDDDALGQACHRAHHRYRLRPEAVARLLTERGAAKGSGRLMRILQGDDPLVLSRLEREFIRLLRLERRQLPVTNRHTGEGYIDCEWPDLDLIVELDSYRFHGSRRAWERDRQRDRAARRRGKELIRYTWGDIFEDPDPVRAEMRHRLPLAAP